MDEIKRTANKMYLAFSKGGLSYVASRIPSILFWSTISTGLLIGAQFLYFSMLPANYFFKYDNPAVVADVELGEKPIVSYCRYAREEYPVHMYAQIRKVEPPVFTQNYDLTTTIPAGRNCSKRETAAGPTVPGEYQIFYTAEVTLPFGIKKLMRFETEPFVVSLPQNLYSEYRLTIVEKDQQRDGTAMYRRGEDLQYTFTATLLVTTFGTLERHIVCDSGDYLIDTTSGRTQAGVKDTVDRTLTLPNEASGTCRLEKRYIVTIEGGTQTVSETLRSNDFRVE